MNNRGSLDSLDMIVIACAFLVVFLMLGNILDKLDIIIENMNIEQKVKVEYVVPITQHTTPIYNINLREGEI